MYYFSTAVIYISQFIEALLESIFYSGIYKLIRSTVNSSCVCWNDVVYLLLHSLHLLHWHDKC